MAKAHRPTMDTYGHLFEDKDEDVELYGVGGDPEVEQDRRTYQSVGIERDRRDDDAPSGKPKGPYTRDDGADGLHSETMYDEDTDAAGNLVDERTGEAFDNSTFTDELAVLQAGGRVIELGLEEPIELPDAADHFLSDPHNPIWQQPTSTRRHQNPNVGENVA